MSILSLIFPEKCAFCGKALKTIGVCDTCKTELPWWGGCEELADGLKITAPLKYEGKARFALLNFKFHGRKNHARTFADLMEVCIQNHYGADSFDAVTFVPLHWLRRLKRGYNQTELLANALSRKFGVQVLKTLTKPKRAKANSGLNSAQRAGNVTDAFRIKCSSGVSGKRILLIDDVCTTGATLRETAKILIQAGASDVICAAVCRTV
ncbi:MAG: ComF family protein [Oscillospiraceae bacterium]|jgi:ComF family protein|nr:ComF family protein [Oscillospiraceae bacterium]